MLVRKKSPARIAVVRVKRLAVPRLDEAGAAAHAEAAAFGFLQQHGADQHRDDHEVNDDNDGLHLKNFRHKRSAPGFGCTKSLRVFLKLRGVTRSDRALSPPTAAVEIIAAGATAGTAPACRPSNPT